VDLVTESLHGIQLDRCPECRGVWFEAAEAEALIESEKGSVSSLFKSLIRGVSST
jgi:Zn-finger nucleic acid-binding protein